jgi:hypothetical protein
VIFFKGLLLVLDISRTPTPKATQMTLESSILRVSSLLSVRELADRNLNDVLSVPTELMGEFREEDGFKSVMKGIDEADADSAISRGRGSVIETYYWRVIQQRAKTIGPFLDRQAGRLGLLLKRSIRPRRFSAG